MSFSSSVRSTVVHASALCLLAIGSAYGQAGDRPAPGSNPPVPGSLSAGEARAALRAEQFRSMKAAAQAKGTVDVIVEFAVPQVAELTSRALTAREPIAAGAKDAELARAIGAVSQAELGKLAGTRHRVKHQYSSIPFAALSVSPEALAALEASADVVGVNEDALARPMLNNTVNIIEASSAWAAGFDGAGYYVAVLDTGVLSSHILFAGKSIRQVCFASGDDGLGDCPNGNTVDTSSADAAEPYPSNVAGYDHGTHVAGIAVGNAPSIPLFGVARGADLIAVKVFSVFTSGCGNDPPPCVRAFTSDQIAAMEFLFNNRTLYNIASLNLSLGGGQFTSQGSCDQSNAAQKTAIDNLRAAGIATVIAAGNDGFCPGLSAPGCISSAIGVGATTDSDGEASFSNYDALLLDVFAPGVGVLSSVPSSTTALDSFSGTSMATPHVAGAVAVLKQGTFGEGVDAIFQALETTGDPVSGRCVPNPAQGRINVFSALESLAPIAHPCELTRLAPAPPAAGEQVGTSVAMRGDVAVVGAPLRGGSGAALVYRRNSVAWPEQQVLTASNATPGDLFGQAVGVEGDVVVVGAPLHGGSGAAYVYRLSGGVWQEVQILTASDGAAGDEFGAAVAIRGDVIAVGARARDCVAGVDCGAVYVYRFDGSSWTGEQRITASDAALNARFGFSLDANNTRVLVGSPNRGCGTLNNCGTVYSYEWNGSAWTGEVIILGIGRGAGDWYGQSVALDGDFAMVGSPQDDLGGSNAGSAYLFERSGATWIQRNRMSASDVLAQAQFGSAVALDVAGERLVVSAAFGDAPGAGGAGAVYVFRNAITGWVELGKLEATGLAAGDQFGGAIALGGSYTIVGARLNDGDGVEAGAAYVHAVSLDCNRTGLADACDIAGATSEDCNGNAIPDACEAAQPDCNNNTIADACDIRDATSQDCNANTVPDECEPAQPDCNNNTIADGCDIRDATSQDCNFDVIPDECQPDEDCNGNTIRDICDIGSGFSVDCNGNLVPDDCDIAGGSPDNNSNGIPDDCECHVAAPAVAEEIMNPAGTPVASVKNRMLSFSGGEAGLQQAVRVKFVSLPGDFSVFNGTTAWVALPQPASELPGKTFTDPIGAETTFMVARLVGAPVYADWSTLGIVHVYDQRIIPSRKQGALPLEPAVYELQLVTTACDVGFEASYSPALSLTNPRWGDVASLESGEFRAPDGSVDVTSDVLGVLAKFGGASGAPIKSRVDLVGTGATGTQPELTGKIDISDVLAALSAFSGGSYPFAPVVGQ